MTQSLISLLILAFIVITHIMAWKWAAYIQKNMPAMPGKDGLLWASFLCPLLYCSV